MKTEAKLSNTAQTLLWFGAAVSLAEILTGTFIAPLGLGYGILAVLIGHVIGAVIFYLAGYIGAKENLTALESAGISFGKTGVRLFSILNVIQLIGWTAVMTQSGAAALLSGGISLPLPFLSVMIGVFILIFILIGFKNLTLINYFAVGALFILTIVLGFVIFKNPVQTAPATDSLSFGAAVELSVTMPLSWLPLVSDYTKNNKNTAGGTMAAALGYFVGSCAMYIIGLGTALYCGGSGIAPILLSAGLGIFAVMIALLSTVTTTFLDVYSGGISIVNMDKRVNKKAAAVIELCLGLILAVFAPMSYYENFLYFIGSVFAPLFAVLIVDYYLYRKINSAKTIDVGAFMIWGLGFIAYRVLLNFDLPVGTTLPVMMGTGIVCIVYRIIYSLIFLK